MDECNPERINNGAHINFAKLRQIHKAISTLRRFQATPYSLPSDNDELASVFTAKTPVQSDEELYAMSLLREPRNAELSELL